MPVSLPDDIAFIGTQTTDWTQNTIILADTEAYSRSLNRQVLIHAGASEILKATTTQDTIELLEDTQEPILATQWNEHANIHETGPCLVRAIRKIKELATTPIMLISAQRPAQEIEIARDCGADSVTLRPISPSHMQLRMNQMFQERRPFVFTPNYTGPDRRSGRKMRGQFKRCDDVNNGYVSELEAIQNQAADIIETGQYLEDSRRVRIGQSLSTLIENTQSISQPLKVIVERHHYALSEMSVLAPSDQTRYRKIAHELDQTVANYINTI